MTLIQSYNTFMMEYLKGFEGIIFQLADVFTTPINSTTVKNVVGKVRGYVSWKNDEWLFLLYDIIQGMYSRVDVIGRYIDEATKPTPTSNKSRPDQSHSNSPREAILSRVVLTTIQVAYVYSNVYSNVYDL